MQKAEIRRIDEAIVTAFSRSVHDGSANIIRMLPSKEEHVNCHIKTLEFILVGLQK